MKITSTDQLGQNALKILVYGESGAGKTSLAKTIKEPMLIISAEAGLLPLRKEKIDVFDITKADDGSIVPKEERIKRVQDVYKFLLTDEAQKKYKWIYIDSLSELSQNLIESLYVEFPERNQTLPMYGELNKRTRSLVKAFRDLPHYSVVFTALSEVDKDENGVRIMQPTLIGKFATQLPALLDEVFFLHSEKNEETGDVKRVLVTQKTDRLVAKDRSGSLDRIEAADLGLIAKKIRESTEKNAVKQKGETKQ